MPTSSPEWIGAGEILRRVSPDAARQLLRQALADGFDPATDPPRSGPRAGAGQLLIMPSALDDAVGVKVLSVAPDNPARGLPRIQAWYVLMDAATLTPSVLLDGVALTSLRTPGMSMVGADALAPAEIDHVLILGSGPQAIAHAEALLAIRRPRRCLVHSPTAAKAEAAASAIAALGLPATAIASAAVPGVVADADLILCCTSAATPLFDGSLVSEGACVVAIGSHEPDRRELDGSLMGRAQVVVEDAGTALREAGDVVMAIEEGALAASGLVTIRQIVTGEVRPATDRPRVFKTVGMSWQDLVIASAAAHPRA
ncbi:MAG: ornithine cyclodeaminase family protein [Propioniciclava sp.]|uniref:ornithine cyclodeaminase family protein n=1 Tax=Propioniciclava sp. TaxID=2038686 RepID=UPI0039E66BB1